MKTTLLFALFAAFLFACEDDITDKEGPQNAITIQFETAQKEILENAEEQTLQLKLNKPALKDGNILIKVDEGYAGALEITPVPVDGLIQVQIHKGQTTAELKLKPVNNDQVDGNKLVNIRIQSLSSPFVAGTVQTVKIVISDDESPAVESVANFIENSVTLEETNETGTEYQIHLSEVTQTSGTITIKLNSAQGAYQAHFVTEPAAVQDELTLAVAPGARVVTFRLKPVSNSEITGEIKLLFTITGTTGPIAKGTHLTQEVTIKDDELAQKPRGYEITAGNDIHKQFYEYNSNGQIAKVNWESYTPYYRHGTDTYFYNAEGQLTKINKYAGKDINYLWNNARITRSEEVADGTITSFTDYEYDEAGRIAGVISWHRQNDGSYLKGFFTLYLYFLDGNIYKSLTYQDTNDPENPHLVSTKTYDHYLDITNPFPMVSIIPGNISQTKLAGSYRLEEGGFDFLYQLTYEFRPDGLPEKRIATSQGQSQTAVYHYY